MSTRSGRGAARQIGEKLIRGLRSRNHLVSVRLVGDVRRARAQLVREVRGLPCLIGIGGDHTLSELGRVAREARLPLLPVPAGFGNIFAGAFGWRSTVPAVTEALEHGRIEVVDAGLDGEDLFLANQGFGFLERVQLAVETSGAPPRERWRRYHRYVRAAFQSIACTPLPALRVDVDGEPIADRAPLVIVANVPTYRGFMPLVTDASPLDGLLDVFVAPVLSKSSLIAWLLGTLVRAPGCPRDVVRRRSAHVTITEGARRHDIVVVPDAVPVLLPARRRRARTVA
jgi:diacylglycerol kinase (ATP)